MGKRKPSPPGSQGKSKLPPPGYRSPIRISIDHEALAALNKRALGAQIGIGVVAGWLASWLVGGSGLLRYVITGLVGSLVGALVLERLGIDWYPQSTDEPHCDGHARSSDRGLGGPDHRVTELVRSKLVHI